MRDDHVRPVLVALNAVNRLYELLVLKEEDPVEYESKIQFGERYTARWDEPEMPLKRPRPGG